jgi:hypothetical protein
MLKGILKDLSEPAKVFTTVLLCFAGLLLLLMVGVVVVYLCVGRDYINLTTGVLPSDPNSLAAFRILQICQSIGLFIIPGLVLGYLFAETPRSYLGFKTISKKQVGYGVVVSLLAIPGVNLLASINEMIPLAQWMIDMEESAMRLTRAFLETTSYGVLLLNLFMVAVLPAVGEELIFRGIIQKLFTNITGRVVWGVIIASALFSFFHFQFQGFIPRFALGMLFGYLYAWTGTIWLPIITHFVNNALATFGYFLISKGSIAPGAENIGGFSDIWLVGVLSFVAIGAILWRIRSEGLPGHQIGQASLEKL